MSDKILDKINKLLEHSRSAREIDSLSEAASFAEKAQKLLDEHNLTMTDVEQHALMNEDIGQELLDVRERFEEWYWTLLGTLSDINGCYCVFGDKTGTGAAALVPIIVGRKTDRSIVRNLMEHFIQIGDRLARQFAAAYRQTAEYYFYGTQKLDTQVTSYLLGFALGVSSRLRQVHNLDRKREAAKTALVLVDKRAEQAKSFVHERGEVIEFEQQSEIDRDILSLGHMEGQRAALSDKMLAAERK